MNCPGCNSEVQAGATFCTKCGFQLKQPRGPREMAAASAAQPPQAGTGAASPKHAVLSKKAPPEKPSISPSTLQVAASKKLQGRYKIDECLTIFGELAAYDASTDMARGQAGKRALISFIAAFVSIFITAMSSFLPLALLIVAGVVYGFINVAKWLKLKKQDLLNDFRLCLVPLLEMLREDIDDKERVKLDLNLAGATQEKIVSSKGLNPKDFGPRVITIKRTTYRDPWCTAEIPLVDGSVIGLRIENFYLKFDRKQRGTSGKIKYKTKWKKRSVAWAVLEPNAGDFSWDSAKLGQQPPEHKVKLKDKSGAKACRVVRKFKYKPEEDRMAYIAESPYNLYGASPMDACMHPREIFAMMLELFAMLKPVKEESA